MVCIVNIFDKDTSDLVSHEKALSLSFNVSEITVKELIENRVTEEFSNIKKGIKTTPLIRRKSKSGKKPEEEVLKSLVDDAISAFQSNSYFIIVDDEQVSSLTEKIPLSQTTNVEFYGSSGITAGSFS